MLTITLFADFFAAAFLSDCGHHLRFVLACPAHSSGGGVDDE